MRVFVLVLAILFIISTGLPLLRQDYWLIRIFEFPRLQLFFFGLFITLLYVVSRQHTTTLQIAFLFILILALAFQGFHILRYTPIYPKQVLSAQVESRDTTITLMVANVLMSNRNADQLIELIHQNKPDIICTVETDEWWEQELRSIEAAYTFYAKAPKDNTYGMLLYSRLPLQNTEVRYIIEEDVPSIYTAVRLRSGAVIDLYCLHPKPPYPTEAKKSSQRDAELLIVGNEVSKNQPTIVIGDLNDVAWSHTTSLFQDISGLLDPRIGRGMFNTFHADYPFLRYPLDHMFHSEHFTLMKLARLPSFGSDHFAILGQLVLERDAKRIQEKPHATMEEQEEAQKQIEKGKKEEAQESL